MLELWQVDFRGGMCMDRYLGVQKRIFFQNFIKGAHPQGAYRLVTTITGGGTTGLPECQGLKGLTWLSLVRILE